MKRLFLGLLLAAVAAGGSAFTNARKSITENYLLQTSSGYFIRQSTAPGICTSDAVLNCEYAVTAFGRLYIPAQTSYSSTDVQNYLDNDYLEAVDGVGPGLYHAP